MTVNKSDLKALMRRIARDKSRTFAVVGSHWSQKHRLVEEVLRGRLSRSPAGAVEVLDPTRPPLTPADLARCARPFLDIPERRAGAARLWVERLQKKCSRNPLILVFRTPVILSPETERLLLDLLTSYKLFCLILVFDLSWKKELIPNPGNREARRNNERILQCIDTVGHLLRQARRWDAAQNVYDYPSRILFKIRDTFFRGVICLNLATLLQRRAHAIRPALKLYRRGIEDIRLADPNHELLRAACNNLGNLYISLAKYAEAETQFKMGLEYAQRTQDDYSMAVAYSSLGRNYIRMGEHEKAEDALWTAAVHLIRSTRYDGVHYILNSLGQIAIHRKQPQEALGFFQQSHQISKLLRHAEAIGMSLMYRGVALGRLDRAAQAKESFDEALEIFRKLGRLYDAAFTHHYYYRFALRIGDAQLARRHFDAGLRLTLENHFEDMRALFRKARFRKFSLGEKSEAPAAPAAVAPPKVPAAGKPSMEIRFWGTRGSIPTSSERHTRYGGNTSCVSIRIGGRLLILDAGTGIRFLGQEILKDPSLDPRLTIFISHTHWDHIQGFPFFTPAYLSKFTINVWGPEHYNRTIGEVFQTQMRYEFFPVRLDSMRADIHFFRTQMGDLQTGLPCRVSAFVLNHPVLIYGYRIEHAGRSVVFATDSECLRPNRPPLVKGRTAPNIKAYNFLAEIVNRRLDPFFANADLLICDAQYTEQEIEDKTGWGHSTLNDALDLATRSRARRLVLFHHDPTHEDRQIEEMEATIRKTAHKRRIPVQIEAAREGRVIRV
ncbi:tetratricopeptide repeat protein [bacterium]|nr:tetratricopeptide repeat protein [bacterium]